MLRIFSSFKNAFLGIKLALKEEQSFRIQLVIAFLVVVLMFIFPLSLVERLILVVLCGFVLGLELLNSQLERVLDLIQPKYDSRVKAIKDLSAGAVLIASLTAFLIGLFIILFHLL